MGFWQHRIYPILPVFFQHAATSAYGWMWMKRRFGGIYEAEYKKYKDRESFTREQWIDFQTEQLRRILVHSYDTVPYYQQHFKERGWTRSALMKFELEDLRKLPFLTKDTLRKLGTTSLCSVIREKGGEFFASSGSTGTPTRILYSLPFHQRVSAAYEARVRNWAGVNRFMARAMIGGRRVVPQHYAKPPYGRYNYFEKQLYLSAYHISRSTAKDYIKQICAFRSQYMVGYAMSHFFLARFVDELGLDAPEMKAVITSSEKLTIEMRKLFKKVYGCDTFDGWSGVENCGLISQNEYGELLVSPDVGILEILDNESNPIRPGEVGEVVCTGLLNFDQPLIRYKIGDQIRLRDNQATRCGREMPVIEEILGRVEDVVIGRDGREMVRFHGLFINLSSVAQAQVVQEDYDDFIINVVPVEQLSEQDKSLIITRMKSQLGDIRIHFNELEQIPAGPGGKFQAVVSKVKRESVELSL